jgi:hypothetical protein
MSNEKAQHPRNITIYTIESSYTRQLFSVLQITKNYTFTVAHLQRSASFPENPYYKRRIHARRTARSEDGFVAAALRPLYAFWL